MKKDIDYDSDAPLDEGGGGSGAGSPASRKKNIWQRLWRWITNLLKG